MFHAAAGVHRLAGVIAAVPPAPREADLACVMVHRDLDSAAAAWSRLESIAAISPYQALAWQRAWFETRGRSLGVKPFIVTAHDTHGAPIALLPLGLRRRGLLKVATFLGGRDANFHMGVFHPDLRWSARDIEALLRRAGAEPGSPDLFALGNQVHRWDGVANPFARLPHQPSPSFGYKAALQRDPEAYFKATLSKDSRRKLRRKAEKLADIGALEHRVASTPSEASTIIDAFERQRRARCATLGLSVAAVPDQIALLKRASLAESHDAPVELHALVHGEHILATFGGTGRGGRFCGMVISFDAESELARFSPGDLLLAMVIRAKCREGIAVFDLGIGEARYKDSFCPDSEPLFDVLVPVTALGRVAAAAEALRLRTKRAVKQSRWSWALARNLRRRIRQMT